MIFKMSDLYALNPKSHCRHLPLFFWRHPVLFEKYEESNEKKFGDPPYPPKKADFGRKMAKSGPLL